MRRHGQKWEERPDTLAFQGALFALTVIFKDEVWCKNRFATTLRLSKRAKGDLHEMIEVLMCDATVEQYMFDEFVGALIEANAWFEFALHYLSTSGKTLRQIMVCAKRGLREEHMFTKALHTLLINYIFDVVNAYEETEA